MENNKAMYQQERPATLGHKIRVKIRQLIARTNCYLINKYVWKIRSFRLSFIHHVKCFAVFWKLPNAIHGMEQLLLAETLEHKDTKDALATAEGRVENLIDQCIDRLPPDATGEKPCPKAAKEFYEGLDMRVPDEYLTEDEFSDRAEDDHDSYLCSGGIPDDVEIVDARYDGRKLLGIKSEMVLIDKWDDGKPLPKHLVTWEEKITIKKGGWNITRNYRAATLGGGWKNV